MGNIGAVGFYGQDCSVFFVCYIIQLRNIYALQFGEFPLDIPFANATNYNFLIAANYIPAPTVHTNGVWSIKGFIIPAGGKPPSPATYAFPNTKTIKREDQ